jgi:hypothetical protein
MLDLNRVLAFAVEPSPPPCEVRVNFGVFAGRKVTSAEIDDLARALVPEFGRIVIVAEERHEVSTQTEMSVHQLRIELPEGADTDRVVVLAEHWAQSCIADRHAEINEP